MYVTPSLVGRTLGDVNKVSKERREEGNGWVGTGGGRQEVPIRSRSTVENSPESHDKHHAHFHRWSPCLESRPCQSNAAHRYVNHRSSYLNRNVRYSRTSARSTNVSRRSRRDPFL